MPGGGGATTPTHEYYYTNTPINAHLTTPLPWPHPLLTTPRDPSILYAVVFLYMYIHYEHSRHGIPWQLSACGNSVYQADKLNPCWVKTSLTSVNKNFGEDFPASYTVLYKICQTGTESINEQDAIWMRHKLDKKKIKNHAQQIYNVCQVTNGNCMC